MNDLDDKPPGKIPNFMIWTFVFALWVSMVSGIEKVGEAMADIGSPFPDWWQPIFIAGRYLNWLVFAVILIICLRILYKKIRRT